MSFQTMCCYYCGFTALVGIYFHLVLSAMEYKENQAMKYHWNIPKATLNSIFEKYDWDVKKEGDPSDAKLEEWGYSIDMSKKGTAFLILAIIQLAFFLCCCGLGRYFQLDQEKKEN